MRRRRRLPPNFPMQAFYTPAELARLLGVDASTVRRWIRLDRLVAYRLAERVTHIPLSSVMELHGNSQQESHRTLSPEEEAAVWAEGEAERPRS